MARINQNFFRKQSFRFLISVLAGALTVVLSFTFLLAGESGEVTRAEFIEILARSHPEHPLLPRNPGQTSRNQLFLKTKVNLAKQGIRVWENKKPDGKLTHLEFVRVAYAFSGGPRGQSLFKQKLYLKKRGVVSSSDIGLTTDLKGKVLQYHEKQDAGGTLQLASPIFIKDRIRTDSGSRAALTFDDQSTLTMSDNTEVTITKHIYNPDKDFRKTLVKVSLGTVRFVVSKARGKGSIFKVVTPTATAGVRGTEFAVIVEPDGRTRFLGITDEIRTSPLMLDKRELRRETVGPGQTQVFSRRGKASPVTSAPAEWIERVRKKTKWSHKKRHHREREVTKEQAKRVAALTREAEKTAIKAENEAARDLEKAARKAMEEAVKKAEKEAKKAEKAAKEALKSAKKIEKDANKSAKETAKEAAKAAEEAVKEALKDQTEDSSGSNSGHGGGGGND